MAEISVEDEAQSPYPRSMETRVALLENTTADLRFEIREVKTMVRDLATEMREGFRAINVKFEVTDKAISDLRVDVQSVRTEFKSEIQSVRTEFKSEIQSVRTDVERGLRDNLSKTVVWFGVMISIAVAVIAILVKLPHF